MAPKRASTSSDIKHATTASSTPKTPGSSAKDPITLNSDKSSSPESTRQATPIKQSTNPNQARSVSRQTTPIRSPQTSLPSTNSQFRGEKHPRQEMSARSPQTPQKPNQAQLAAVTPTSKTANQLAALSMQSDRNQASTSIKQSVEKDESHYDYDHPLMPVRSKEDAAAIERGFKYGFIPPLKGEEVRPTPDREESPVTAATRRRDNAMLLHSAHEGNSRIWQERYRIASSEVETAKQQKEARQKRRASNLEPIAEEAAHSQARVRRSTQGDTTNTGSITPSRNNTKTTASPKSPTTSPTQVMVKKPSPSSKSSTSEKSTPKADLRVPVLRFLEKQYMFGDMKVSIFNDRAKTTDVRVVQLLFHLLRKWIPNDTDLTMLQALLKYQPVRGLQWHKRSTPQLANILKTLPSLYAAMAYCLATGRVEYSCQRCSEIRSLGPSQTKNSEEPTLACTTCIIMKVEDGSVLFKGACTNCVMEGCHETCSFHEDNKQSAPKPRPNVAKTRKAKEDFSEFTSRQIACLVAGEEKWKSWKTEQHEMAIKGVETRDAAIRKGLV
ncbi:hypothetical protein BT63DRAFT_258548 [Microthyrium microscopicum]|uniref:Uncharacterized protein n=1 Tax=Microthyrium microscopicum TaxID=703497 RepID=A0A6A6UBJ7_9PEZI|nr:hypothetical protein BT63DRAFT_258548 [Microthyrium microscopicum]